MPRPLAAVGLRRSHLRLLGLDLIELAWCYKFPLLFAAAIMAKIELHRPPAEFSWAHIASGALPLSLVFLVLSRWLRSIYSPFFWNSLARPFLATRRPPRRPSVDEKLDQAVDVVRRQLGRGKAAYVDVDVDVALSSRSYSFHRFGLTVGLPVLSFSAEEVTALLAATLARPRGLWLDRHFFRSSLNHQIREGLFRDAKHPLFGLSPRFYGWLLPLYQQALDQLGHDRALDCDRRAAGLEHVGAKAMARAMVKLHVVWRFLDEAFWPSVWAKAHTGPLPEDIGSELLAALSWLPDHPELGRWYKETLAQPPSPNHPSLRLRLAALGEEPAVVDLFPQARSFLDLAGEQREARIAQHASEAWAAAAVESWQGTQEADEQVADLLKTYEVRDRARMLDGEGLEQYGLLLQRADRGDEARPLFERALADDDERPLSHFHLAQYLLDEEDESGLEHLERAAELDPNAIIPAYQAAEGYLRTQGRTDEAGAYRHRIEEQEKRLSVAQQERQSAHWQDSFLSPDVTPQARQALAKALEGQPAVLRGFIARKEVGEFSEYPQHVVCLLRGFSKVPNAEIEARLVASGALPPNCIVHFEGKGDGLWRKLAKLPGAEFYRARKAAGVPWVRTLVYAWLVALAVTLGLTVVISAVGASPAIPALTWLPVFVYALFHRYRSLTRVV